MTGCTQSCRLLSDSNQLCSLCTVLGVPPATTLPRNKTIIGGDELVLPQSECASFVDSIPGCSEIITLHILKCTIKINI